VSFRSLRTLAILSSLVFAIGCDAICNGDGDYNICQCYDGGRGGDCVTFIGAEGYGELILCGCF
jgi:hypothetical protein